MLWLALLGITLAAVPLLYVWRSNDPYKFRKLAWITAFLTLDLIMLGSFTRLTDSGLGCPDWPGCYGHSNPWSANEPIQAAQTALPSGPVTQTKAWIEMAHRYLALAVGVLIIVLAVHAWRRRATERPPHDSRGSRWLGTAALLWVCVQGAFGALTVTMKLQPAVVTLHLLGGVVLLALLTWLALREGPEAQVIEAERARVAAMVALLAVFVQIALGGWVSSNYAVMACPDFPLCQGQLLPPMDFANGFTWWRGLGRTGQGDLIPFQALVAIHWAHRVFAVVVVAAVMTLIWHLRRHAGLRPLANALSALLLLQLLTGLSNVVLQWPLLLAVLHSGGAALLVALLVAVLHRTSRKSLDFRLFQAPA
ncbi:MAG: COX15/CtaA family protein [Burkholderiaceae bacterium]|nr:COX15/CtaA family protein [Burkholderiaceae bacterium]